MGAACGCETSNDQQPHNPSHKSNIGGIPDATWDTLNWETASKDQVNQLLSMGLDVNASLDSKGRTPTMLAVKYNRAGALQRLLEAEVSRERLNAPSDPFPAAWPCCSRTSRSATVTDTRLYISEPSYTGYTVLLIWSRC